MEEFQNSLDNKNLDIAKKGIIIEPLGEILNFNSDDFDVVNGSLDGEVNVTLRPRAVTYQVSRSFNTNFTVSATRDAICVYTIELIAATSISGGQTSEVYAQVRPTSSDPFVIAATVYNRLAGALILGIGITSTKRMNLVIYAPAGYEVRLQTNHSGGSANYITGQEILL